MFSLVFQFIVQLHLAEDCMKRYNQTALKDLCAVEQVSVSLDNVISKFHNVKARSSRNIYHLCNLKGQCHAIYYIFKKLKLVLM